MVVLKQLYLNPETTITMKTFLEHLLYFLLGIVLITPWVYKIIIYDGEYVAGGLPGIGGLFYELLAGIGLMFVFGILSLAYDNLIKYRFGQITLHYTKTGLRIISILVGVVFLISGIFLIKEEFEASVGLIFVSVPLIVIGCKLPFKIMLYLFAILIVLFPFFNSSLPNLSVFNFVFAAVLIWVAEAPKTQQDKVVKKVKKEENKKILKLLGRPLCLPNNKLFPDLLNEDEAQLTWLEIILIPCFLWCFYFVFFSGYFEYKFDSFIGSMFSIFHGIFLSLFAFGLLAFLISSLFLFLNNLFSK